MEKEKLPDGSEKLNHYEKAVGTLKVVRQVTAGVELPVDDYARLLVNIAQVEALLAICESLSHPNTLFNT